jgi:hypothetical protein
MDSLVSQAHMNAMMNRKR